MKSILTFTLIILSLSMSAQFGDKPQVVKLRLTEGFDIANAFVGGKKLSDGTRRNPRALGYRGRLSLQDNRIEAGLTIERFKAIEYKSIGIDLNVVNTFEDLIKIQNKWLWFDANLEIVYGVEALLVDRRVNVPMRSDEITHFNYALNLRFRVDEIADTGFFIELALRLNRRNDIYYYWSGSEGDFFSELWEHRDAFFSVGYAHKF